MSLHEILDIVLPIVYVIVGLSLIWLLIELVALIRRTNRTVKEVKQQIDPTLESVQRITKSVEPAVAKVDPLISSASLTVDSLNVEMMRVDGILQDVQGITSSANSAVGAVESVTNAPMDIVNMATSKLRNLFRTKGASKETQVINKQKSQVAAQDVTTPGKGGFIYADDKATKPECKPFVSSAQQTQGSHAKPAQSSDTSQLKDTLPSVEASK